MARKKKVNAISPDVYIRQTVIRKDGLNYDTEYNINELSLLAENKVNARISVEVVRYYDDTEIHLNLLWDELETDKEMNSRIKIAELEFAKKEAARIKREAAQAEADLAEFNRLKKKLKLD